MGQRANLITIVDGRYTLRYDHWCANRLDAILFWDIGYALDYFDAQEDMGEEGWLDDVWAEGGAVIDLDKKHLLWWGSEDIMYEPPLRRVYLKLQQRVWKDWTIAGQFETGFNESRRLNWVRDIFIYNRIYFIKSGNKRTKN